MLLLHCCFGFVACPCFDFAVAVLAVPVVAAAAVVDDVVADPAVA